ncbi:MAG: phage baseplate assembly protein [Gallionella sp.]|nr:phage baseplate assembly protein [Gallionella sp.]MDD4947449.1 phage baseplate assembly protein [Gallionella sp.]MDD5613414.1 phage baseplate assembly protein [Gallionella sp.]
MMRQVWNRLQLLCAQGVGTLIGADKVQVKVLDGETLNNIDRVEPYGFSYRPKPGCRAHLFFPAGDRSYGVALVVGDKRYQMDLKEGEVALHDDEGNHVHLKRGGVVEVKAATRVIAQTPLFETSGDAKVGGHLTVLSGISIIGTATANGKDISDSHTHTTTTTGAPTSAVN